ncbi:MAG: response regulator transcription factor [Clostridiales bacterium]|jgi:DNA-binding response OmpR family regulator|nr:response regulator transcription factor [Clostridiales bacterium]
MKRVLIIEDDKSISELQKDYLEMSGYEAVCAFDGASGLELLERERFDLVLLDLMLPERDGFDILSRVSATKEIPVLIVSAKSDEANKIRGFKLGADDYITKPFGMGELVARVNRHIKTYEKLSKGAKREVLEAGALTIDKQDRRVFVDGREIPLTQKEFDLLLFLAENPNRVFGKETLFEKVWGYDALSDTTTVTVHVARIREKIEGDSGKYGCIETVWGAGYRFKV